ncbi:hypothetical protein LXL04_011034 [Taraxacum kok-saghyz]
METNKTLITTWLLIWSLAAGLSAASSSFQDEKNFYFYYTPYPTIVSPPPTVSFQNPPPAHASDPPVVSYQNPPPAHVNNPPPGKIKFRGFNDLVLCKFDVHVFSSFLIYGGLFAVSVQSPPPAPVHANNPPPVSVHNPPPAPAHGNDPPAVSYQYPPPAQSKTPPSGGSTPPAVGNNPPSGGSTTPAPVHPAPSHRHGHHHHHHEQKPPTNCGIPPPSGHHDPTLTPPSTGYHYNPPSSNGGSPSGTPTTPLNPPVVNPPSPTAHHNPSPPSSGCHCGDPSGSTPTSPVVAPTPSDSHNPSPTPSTGYIYYPPAGYHNSPPTVPSITPPSATPTNPPSATPSTTPPSATDPSTTPRSKIPTYSPPATPLIPNMPFIGGTCKQNLFTIILISNAQFLENTPTVAVGPIWVVAYDNGPSYGTRPPSWIWVNHEFTGSAFKHKNRWHWCTLPRRDRFFAQLHGQQELPLHNHPRSRQFLGGARLKQGGGSSSACFQAGKRGSSETESLNRLYFCYFHRAFLLFVVVFLAN